MHYSILSFAILATLACASPAGHSLYMRDLDLSSDGIYPRDSELNFGSLHPRDPTQFEEVFDRDLNNEYPALFQRAKGGQRSGKTPAPAASDDHKPGSTPHANGGQHSGEAPQPTASHQPSDDHNDHKSGSTHASKDQRPMKIKDHGIRHADGTVSKTKSAGTKDRASTDPSSHNTKPYSGHGKQKSGSKKSSSSKSNPSSSKGKSASHKSGPSSDSPLQKRKSDYISSCGSEWMLVTSYQKAVDMYCSHVTQTKDGYPIMIGPGDIHSATIDGVQLTKGESGPTVPGSVECECR